VTRHLIRNGLILSMALGGQVKTVAGQAPTPAPTVTVGGVGYAQYYFNLKDSANHVNNFDVTRAYINVIGRFPHGIRTRVTPDIYRVADGSLAYRLKYAFVAWTPANSALTFKFGQNNTPFVDWEERLWDYRMQGTIAMDRNGYISSSDFGFLIDGNWGTDKLSISAGVQNGENYNRAPGDKGKDFVARASVRLLATDEGGETGGLRLTGYAGVGRPTGGGTRQRFLGVASYRSKLLTLAAELAATRDSTLADSVDGKRKGRVITTFGVLRIPPSYKFHIIARLDAVDPHTGLDDDRQTRIIAGIAYQLTPNLRLLADLDHLSYQGGITTPALEAVRSQALFQVQFTF
jgi:hypothetical protein